MANAHSHAFQRGMAGNTEYRLSARDSFWTWRQAMYALANRITPPDLELIATQLFVEMLKAGYTSVAEFHYLHRQPGGAAYAETNELWRAIARAADTAGIALTFLPTLYQTSDFGSQPLKPEQSRFAMTTDEFLRAVETRVSAERQLAAPRIRTGAAFHSLRAVPLETLREAVAGLYSIDADMPVHIHIAEQLKEVEACRASTGRRPIELLLETGLVNARWCLVHATHATPAELDGIAAAGAAVCVSISTEANLGDGFFDAARFLKSKGRLCVGSDSQADRLSRRKSCAGWSTRRACANAAAACSRNRASRMSAPACGARLRAKGRRPWDNPPESLRRARARIGWSSIPSTPAWPAHAQRRRSTISIFAGGSAAIRDVMVGGRWVVKDRRHAAEERLAGPFRELMIGLALERD